MKEGIFMTTPSIRMSAFLPTFPPNRLHLTRATTDGLATVPQRTTSKWTWACRAIEHQQVARLLVDDPGSPHVGDLALVEVVDLGHHTKIQTAANESLRLYPGDTLVGVFGNRYATDAFEAEVCAVDSLHLLTAAGMIGTVRSQHRDTKSPTRLAFLGIWPTRRGSG
jgi:hypothetical protein